MWPRKQTDEAGVVAIMDLLENSWVSYMHSILLTFELLSASRPLLHKILNTVLKFSLYGKCI